MRIETHTPHLARSLRLRVVLSNKGEGEYCRDVHTGARSPLTGSPDLTRTCTQGGCAEPAALPLPRGGKKAQRIHETRRQTAKLRARWIFGLYQEDFCREDPPEVSHEARSPSLGGRYSPYGTGPNKPRAGWLSGGSIFPASAIVRGVSPHLAATALPIRNFRRSAVRPPRPEARGL
jgi:hypothetical protein